MTREEAYARCSSDSYVEFYGGQWLIVPFALSSHHFFICLPEGAPSLNGRLGSK